MAEFQDSSLQELKEQANEQISQDRRLGQGKTQSRQSVGKAAPAPETARLGGLSGGDSTTLGYEVALGARGWDQVQSSWP